MKSLPSALMRKQGSLAPSWGHPRAVTRSPRDWPSHSRSTKGCCFFSNVPVALLCPAPPALHGGCAWLRRAIVFCPPPSCPILCLTPVGAVSPEVALGRLGSGSPKRSRGPLEPNSESCRLEVCSEGGGGVAS